MLNLFINGTEKNTRKLRKSVILFPLHFDLGLQNWWVLLKFFSTIHLCFSFSPWLTFKFYRSETRNRLRSDPIMHQLTSAPFPPSVYPLMELALTEAELVMFITVNYWRKSTKTFGYSKIESSNPAHNFAASVKLKKKIYILKHADDIKLEFFINTTLSKYFNI